MDKMQKSLENLVNVLLDATNQIKDAKNYEEIDLMLPTINDLTTNIKRMFDMGYIHDLEQNENIDKNVKEEEVIEDA